MSNPFGEPPQYQPRGGQPAGQPFGAPPQYGPPPAPQPPASYPPAPPAGFAPPPPQVPPASAPHPPSQPYAQPAQPPMHQPGPPGIMLNTSYTPLAFMLGLFSPRIEVNGQQVPNPKWGQTHIPVPPGQYHLRVSTRYLWDFGAAETAVRLAPGESAPLYYRAPAMAVFVGGAIGPVPQKTPGLVALLIISALPLLLCFLGILASFAMA